VVKQQARQLFQYRHHPCHHFTVGKDSDGFQNTGLFTI